MRIGIIGSFILGTAATIGAAQYTSPQTKTPSRATSNDVVKTKFDRDQVKKLVVDLDSNFYRVREKASNELLKMSKDLSIDGLYDFLIYVLDESVKQASPEVRRRLERVEYRIFETLKQTAASQDKTKRKEVPLRLIEILDKKRSVYVWSRLMPIAVDIVANRATINETFYDEHANSEGTISRVDPEPATKLSELLLSPFDKDSKELQEEATKQIVSLTRSPRGEREIFISLHNIKLEALSKLDEGKLSEIEKGLKELKDLILNGDLSNGLETVLAKEAKPYLEKILEVSVKAFSSSDPKKQALGINNINVLKNYFNNLQIKSLVSTKNGALIFNKRQEFTKDITSSEELQSSIEIAQFISELSKDDIGFHKSYVNWLEKQVDVYSTKKNPDKNKMDATLEHALMEELYTVANSGSLTSLKAEIINPLIRTYTKLAKQVTPDSALLEKNLRAIIEFQYFCHYYLGISYQEKIHPYILSLFDSVTDGIKNLQNTEHKSYLRRQIVTVTPCMNSWYKDYIDKLSKFYCAENGLNTDEFMNLTESLLNSPESKHVGKYLPPEMMLQFIENNTKYFEKNIGHIIEIYNKSNSPAIRSKSKEQLRTLYLSFQRLFNEKEKAKTTDAYLTQYFPSPNVINQGIVSSDINLRYRPELKEQISRIENWFNKRLESPITEITSK